MRRLFAMVIAFLLVGSCGGDDGIARPDEPLDITVDRKVWFSTAEGRGTGGWVDVFHPVDPGPWPVVVLMHGAASQDRDVDTFETHVSEACPPDCVGFYDAHASYLAQQGTVVFFPAVTTDSRLRQVVDDIGCVGAFVAAKASEFGGDPDRTVVVGHSRGATTGAAMAFSGFATEPGADCVVQDDARPTAIGFVGLSGDYHLMGMPHPNQPGRIVIPTSGITAYGAEDEVASSGATAGEVYEACSAYAHLDGDLPPISLYYGTQEVDAAPDDAERFAAALRDAGHEVTVAVYEGEHWQSIFLPFMEAGMDQAAMRPGGNIEATLQMAFE